MVKEPLLCIGTAPEIGWMFWRRDETVALAMIGSQPIAWPDEVYDLQLKPTASNPTVLGGALFICLGFVNRLRYSSLKLKMSRKGRSSIDCDILRHKIGVTAKGYD